MLDVNFQKLRSLTSLVCQKIVILLLLTFSSPGQCQRLRPPQTVVALVGEDVILPCQLQPPLNAFSKSVEWRRLDLQPRFVHVWFEGKEHVSNQNPSYKGRTSVSIDKLKQGDLSLQLSAVKLSDSGVYRCYFPSQSKESTVELVVSSVSSPVILRTKYNSNVIDLQCNSTGWYPEPEVFWLDGEGNLLSAGPPETVRGPDDLYTVSSRVTVEKRHSNSFACRVTQKEIKQTREGNIQFSVQTFKATSCSGHVGVIVALVLILIAASAFVVWKWRQIKDAKKLREDGNEKREREQLMDERKKTEDLEEKLSKLQEELQKKEKEHKDFEKMVYSKLMEQSEELREQIEKLERLMEEMEKNMKDTENKIQSVEKMAQSEQLLEMKNIAMTAKNQLRDRKKEDDGLYMKTHKVLNTTNEILKTLSDRMKEELQGETQHAAGGDSGQKQET